jgi:ribosomal-protein-alanine N-acetyltransferase
MHSESKTQNTGSEGSCYLARLTVDDVPELVPLEDQVQLAFWGAENYRRFLEEFPEYFGCKAVLLDGTGEKKLVGFVFARSVYENLEILKIGVLPVCQHQGIGMQLMETAYAEGIRRGCSRCFLEVRKSNQNAIQFYYRQDFRIAGSRLNYYTDPVEDAWIMERNL